MMAVPDLPKIRWLLERGAAVNAHSKTRYSALLIAAHYPGSSPVLQMLLDRGAQIRLPDGAGRPLFNATPILFATLAVAAIKLLHRAGDRWDEKFLFLGTVPASALDEFPARSDPALFRAFLDLGVAVDYADESGRTLLMNAVAYGHLDVARLLIARGAKVNLADEQGLTALHYAAWVDYGDAAMAQLLLASGCDRGARSKEGLSALDIARKYNARLSFVGSAWEIIRRRIQCPSTKK